MVNIFDLCGKYYHVSRLFPFPPLLPHIRTLWLVQIQPDESNTNPTSPAVPTASHLCVARSRATVRVRNGTSEPVSDPPDAAVLVFAHGQQRSEWRSFNGLWVSGCLFTRISLSSFRPRICRPPQVLECRRRIRTASRVPTKWVVITL